MRFLELHLLAFGPFTDLSLDVSRGEQGLHLLYGPNEAGKSSALRALGQLLFGIPRHSRDNFRHDHPKMRIGARLRDEDGRELHCVRRKGNRKTLRDGDDREPLDDESLARFLGTVDQGMFEAFFGLDHAELVRGGEEILLGEGNLGQILFSSGAGLGSLRDVLHALEAESDGLFRPRARNLPINRDAAELRRIRRELRDSALRGDDWLAAGDELEETQREIEELEAEIKQAESRRSQLDRIRNALRFVSEYRQAVEALTPYRSAPRLADDFRERLDGIRTDLRVAQAKRLEVQRRLEELETRRDGTEPPGEILDFEETMEDLHQGLTSHRRAVRNIPVLEAGSAGLETEVARILRDLGLAGDLETAAALLPGATVRRMINDLAARHSRLLGDMERESGNLAEATRERDAAVHRLDRLPPPPDGDDLRATLRRARQEVGLEGEAATLERERRTLEERLATGLEQLPLWHGSADALARLAVPDAATVKRFEVEFGELERRRGVLVDRIESIRRELERLERDEISELAGYDLPHEGDLGEARERRDRGWRLVRELLAGRAVAPERQAEFIERHGSGDDLPGAYETSVKAADEIADRLRREADRMARRRQITGQRARLAESLGGLKKERTHLDRALAGQEQAWAATWPELDGAPLPPREMEAWLEKRARLLEARESARAKKVEEDARIEQLGSLHDELGRRIRPLATHEPARDLSLGALIERGESVLEGIDHAARERERADEELQRLEADLAAATRRHDLAAAELNRWRNDWNRAIAPLGLAPGTLPDQALVVLGLHEELASRLDEHRKIRTELETTSREVEAFRSEVARVVERVAPDLEGRDAGASVEELMSRLKTARDAKKELADVEALLAGHVREGEEIETDITRLEAQLESLRAEAGCETVEGLAEAERLSRERHELERRVEAARQGIVNLSGGLTVGEFLSRVDAEDVDSIGPRLDGLEETIGEARQRHTALVERRANAQRDLAEMDARSRRGEAGARAEEAEAIRAKLRGRVERYVELSLASAVLKRAIERYRERHQGPVLRIARGLFRRLTLGSFEGLELDFDESGQAIVLGLRRGPGDAEERVRVEGMSEGTRDQLYLALRLASIESYLDEHPPFPLIVDDVLVNFDDERAAATLGALADLSRRAQVIFFTHHRHLVELARATIDPDTLFVTELDRALEPARESGG